ncbi:sulfur carrier protein ThiS [Thiorhodococcus mannitoliphagus]|uniref:Sulfur carrier protein ThiS n=1 Tax=Thiorhodococcus mannitoliphagus TaxID=329406 RepID=A0A6P1DT01_9GAMM|nr:sulfur carrier protein ThiS [Thiorhodococcus mannitoliphagus]NEX21437.1 sulfur carrier protein ThiS [Thiorhodococcus mannitoliphagus]
MQITLNGTPREVADGTRMAELVEDLSLGGQRFAVEVNAELVPRSRFAEHQLSPNDKVEIIQAVGGG